MPIPLPLSLAVEQCIEAILRLDEDTRSRLSELEGKVIRVQVTRPVMEIVLAVVDHRVQVLGVLDTPADTTITGSMPALLSLSRSNDGLYRGDVTIEGDIGTGQVLKEILASVDPDWEEQVSKVLGDSMAHRLGAAGRQFSSWLDRTQASLKQNTSEYLQEESEVLAPNSEVKSFCTEVDEVRAACDRLEARLRRLERLAGENSA